MVGIVGVSLVAGVELIFWGGCLCRWDQVWVLLYPPCIASLVPQNSKAVRSAPDQTATFPEKSLVHLLAVVVGGWRWGC